MLSQLMHLLHLFFALLEASEVILNEERGIELTDGDVIVPCDRQISVTSNRFTRCQSQLFALVTTFAAVCFPHLQLANKLIVLFFCRLQFHESE